MFIEENLNPKKKKTADSIIRVLAKANGISWYQAFNLTVELAKENYTTQHCSDAYEKYLNDKFQKINVFHINESGDKKRYTVKEVCSMKGAYIVKISGGYRTYVEYGNNYDIWDFGYKPAYIIWKVK